MSSILSFSFPINSAGNAIHSLPKGTYNIKIVAETVIKLHKMAELSGALRPTRFENDLKSAEKNIHLDLSSLDGLQFIGRWGSLYSRENSEYSGFRGATYLFSISLPRGIQFIGNESFQSCSNLEKIQLPSTLRSIGESAFVNCSRLKELVIPEGVETIGEYGYGYGYRVRDNICRYIGDEYGHYTLYNIHEYAVIMEGVEPPSVSSNTFPERITMYVPEESLEKYNDAYESYGWNIKSIKER